MIIGWRRRSEKDPRLAELVMWDRRLRIAITRDILWSPKQQPIPGVGLTVEFEGLWLLGETRGAPEGHRHCYAAMAEQNAPHFPLMPPHYAEWWDTTSIETGIFLDDYRDETLFDNAGAPC